MSGGAALALLVRHRQRGAASLGEEHVGGAGLVLGEAQPDLYLRIFEPTGIREIHHTADAIRWNASTHEHYRVRIPARALAQGAR